MVSSNFKQLFILISFVIIGGAISKSNAAIGDDRMMDIDQISKEQWSTLDEKTIFFGHQSVGYNILDGVKVTIQHNPYVNLKIVKLGEPLDFDSNKKGILFHAEIGRNFDAYSKVDAFVNWMNQKIGNNVDIAFMKFCFVDIGTETDIKALFEYYKKNMAELKKKFPSTKFVHFTVPLLADQTGLAKWKHRLKGIIKKILGKNEFYENVNKFAFNEMVRAEYLGKEPVFDLAAIESTYPDGKRSTVHVGGKAIETMVPAYTNDGGHLNAEGQKKVAEKLLAFLATLDNE